ncbi:MAG: RNA 2',3'-cyclic phosphodiesterase [bacterium]|nr:RNA 2',3'-cyclic phosphodiesterase [bacterium]
MRYFIALEIPEQSRQQLEMVQQKLRSIIPQARLTDNDKLHLTIAFIGEQPEFLKDELIKTLKITTREIPPFVITPAYIDGFPKLHSAHTLWIGVKGDIDKLMVIREKIKDGLESLGLDTDERRYTPHIAIAKINGDFKLEPEQEKKLQELMSDHFAPIYINSIKLFESVPEEGFHHHNTLAKIPLTGGVSERQV